MCYSQLLSHSSGFAYDHINPALLEWSEYIGRKENTFTGNFVSECLPNQAIILTDERRKDTPSRYYFNQATVGLMALAWIGQDGW